MEHKPKLGLALSGGGARGLAHIGVLKVLEANNIQIDYLAGTSIGGVVAACCAAGLKADEIEKSASVLKDSIEIRKLADPSIHGTGILRGNHLLEFFRDQIRDLRFEQLETPLCLVAVDVKTGREVHLTEGSVSEAMRATISVPGLFSPFDCGDYRFVDGGLLNNLPVDVAYRMGADIVLAVDVTATTDEDTFWQNLGNSWFLPGKLGDMVSLLGDSLTIVIKQHSLNKLEQSPPTFHLKPHIDQKISAVSGYQRVAELVEIGSSVTEVIIDELQEQLYISKSNNSLVPNTIQYEQDRPKGF